MVTIPNVALDLSRNRKERNKGLIEEKGKKIDKCAGCHKELKDEEFIYVCNIHHLAYCNECVTNRGIRVVKSNEVRTCDIRFKTNCIYEKINNNQLTTANFRV